MAAYSKHAGVVFVLSLAASSASAAIPDANGVIHGCYNAITGSTRIIDGNNCGFLEKAVTWSQTGPRGPAGAAGASVSGSSLPVGDSHCPAGGVALTLAATTTYICNGQSANDQIDMGWDIIRVRGPIAANARVPAYASPSPFTPTTGGTCVYNYTGRFMEPIPGVTFTPQLQTNGGNGIIGLNYATAIFPESADTSQAATTAGWYTEVGTDYRPGVTVNTGVDAIPAGSTLEFAVTWICKGGPNASD